MASTITAGEVQSLAAFSTPTICNAIERFNLRLRNEGYMNGTLVNRRPKVQPMVGYAITVQMRAEKPPVKGFSYPDRNDWWDIIANSPSPKIIVIQDTDTQPGVGSVTGEVHAAIFKALGCVGIVTNGAVRDLDALEALNMHIYAGSVSPSHAYAHIADIGKPVVIGSMSVQTGDLLHGDQHGIVNIPSAIVQDIPKMAHAILEHEHSITDFCASSGFSIPALRGLVKAINEESVGS